MADTKPLTNNSVTSELNIIDIRGSQTTATGLYFLLTVIEGQDFGYIFQLDKPELIIGRKEENNDVDIMLQDERTSLKHLLIAKQLLPDQSDSFRVMAIDLGSKNGTYINGKRVSADSQVELHQGDKLQIGNSVLKFEIKNNLDISYHERLYHLVTRDTLTGLWNHNYSQQELAKLISLGTRHQLPFSLLLIEIDFFQTVNETYGNSVGDKILRTIAQLIMAPLNDSCIAARFTNHQFLVLMPETDIKGASSIAERIRHKVETFDFTALGCSQRITVSTGITQFPVCGSTKEDLIKQADEALYHAKQAGRNCYHLAELKKQKLPSPQRKKYLKLVLKVLLVLLVVAAGIWAYPRIFASKKLIFSGLVESREILTGSQNGGYVLEVLVEEGEHVKTGQLLVRFDIAPLLAQQQLYESRIKQSEAQLEKLLNGNRPEEIEQGESEARQALATLEALRNGPRPQEISQARSELLAAETALAHSETGLQRTNQIFNQGLTSRQALDDAETAVKSAKTKVDSLRDKLSLLEIGNRVEDIRAAEEHYQQALTKVKILRAGSRREDVAEARARIAEAKAALEQLKTQIKDAEVTAPTNGLVEVLSAHPGNLIAPGKPVVKLLEDNQVWVRIFVPQPELGYLHINQQAAITIDTFPNRSFTGYITQISSQGEFTPHNVQTRKERDYQVFGVKVYLENNNGELKSGMAADVTLQMGK